MKTESHTDSTQSQESFESEERAKKSRALTELFKTTPWGNEAGKVIGPYLHAGADLTSEEFTAGCEMLQDTWTDSNRSPQPGHVRAAGEKFSRKNRSEIRAEQERQRLQHMSVNRMTPKRILAELARMHDDPTAMVPGAPRDAIATDAFEVRVRNRYIRGLERILAAMERDMGARREVGAIISETAAAVSGAS